MRNTLVAAALAGAALLGFEDGLIDVAGRKQLFVDWKLVESAEGVRLRMNPALRGGEILVRADAPWERGLAARSYSSVIKDGGLVRMWYQVSALEHAPGKNPEFMAVAYAESRDGLHFTKPVLGLVEWNGSKANNLVFPTDPKMMAVGGGSVGRDDNPACPPGERYKSWQKVYPKAGTGIAGPHRIWVSPDGLKWKLSERLVTGLRAADTQPTWFWDERTGRYAGYSREWVQFAGEGRIRMASFNESPDMHAWSGMQIALWPDERDFTGLQRPELEPARMAMQGENWVSKQQRAVSAEGREAAPGEDQVPLPGAPVDVYGPGVMPYEGVYVALAAEYWHSARRDGASWPDTGDVRLAVSRDGRNFVYPGGREPFLRLGPQGTFDSKWMWPMVRPVVMGDEVWIYYYGSNRTHSGRLEQGESVERSGISRAVLRLDGFVSADFDEAGGTLLTPKLRFAGSRLELNLDTSAGGVGRIEIVDESGRPVPGFAMADADPLNGNSVRMVATWRGNRDVSALSGQVVRLRMRMRGAKLYAFQFR